MKRRFIGTGFAFLCACLFAPLTHAQTHVSVGGGWNAPRGDSADYGQNGLRLQLGVEQELGENLGIFLDAAYGSTGVNGSKLKTDSIVPPGEAFESETEIYELSLGPKLYLLNRDIAAYVVAGGGPRWLKKTVTSGPGTGVTTRHSEQAWGALLGFGVDLAFSDQFRLGFTPVYHVVFAEKGRLDYVAFTFYVKM